MLLQEDFLRRLDAFSLAMRTFARGGQGGQRRSKTVGSSVEFSDFRGYAPGDDLRRVDWNAFARFDKLFLKLFLDEQETTLRLLLDTSLSMRYGEPDKWPLMLQLAATLAYLSLARYDRVVVVSLSGETVTASRRFAGRNAYLQVEAYLEALVPAGNTRLDTALSRVPVTAGRGVCVLLSDLLSGHDWSRGADALLYRRQELSVLHILAPQEVSPDLSGALQLIDSEGEPSCDVHVSADTLRRYEEALEAFLLAQRRVCHVRGLPYLLLRSDMDLSKDILQDLSASGIVQAR